MRRHHATFRADEAQGLARPLEFDAFARCLFFDMLANSVLTRTAGFDAIPALIKRELVECAVEVDLAVVKMLISGFHGCAQGAII